MTCPAAGKCPAFGDGTTGHAPPGEGWMRRFLTPPARTAEYIALYESLGYEVAAVGVEMDSIPSDCAGCAPALVTYRIIYTRQPR
jgi:hypothetical protein